MAGHATDHDNQTFHTKCAVEALRKYLDTFDNINVKKHTHSFFFCYHDYGVHVSCSTVMLSYVAQGNS